MILKKQMTCDAVDCEVKGYGFWFRWRSMGGFLLSPMYREVSRTLAYSNSAGWSRAKKAYSLNGMFLDNPGSPIRK